MINVVMYGWVNIVMVVFVGCLLVQDIELVVDYVCVLLMLLVFSFIFGINVYVGCNGFVNIDGMMSKFFQNGLQGNVVKGESFYMVNCVICYGVKGDGKGLCVYFINFKFCNFIDFGFCLVFNCLVIFIVVVDG